MIIEIIAMCLKSNLTQVNEVLKKAFLPFPPPTLALAGIVAAFNLQVVLEKFVSVWIF